MLRLGLFVVREDGGRREGTRRGLKLSKDSGEKVWDGVDGREDMTDLQQESGRDGEEEEGGLRANTQKIYIFNLVLPSLDLKALHR